MTKRRKGKKQHGGRKFVDGLLGALIGGKKKKGVGGKFGS